MKKETGGLRALNWLGFAITVVVNALALTHAINGRTTQEASAVYPNLFSPAGFTFGIWGVIYGLLALFCLFQVGMLAPKDKKGVYAIVHRIGLYFFVASVLNATWIFAWHYQKVALSLVIMILLLVMLMIVYRRIDNRTVTAREKWMIRVPFSVYLAWISVATIANAAAFLVAVGWNRWGMPESGWTVLMIVIAAAIALFTLHRKKDIAFVAVFIWAFIGILVKHITMYHSQYALVMITAIAAILVLIVMCIVTFSRNLLSKRKALKTAQTQP